ncbi:MAG: glycosyltransferase [Bacteroidota bacterium]
MNKQNVSLIICTYNEEKYVSNVVRACCEYNPEAEIIVVDDGSTDKTESLLQELAGSYTFIYEQLPKNKGKSWAMVHGVEKSTREIILFFDADVSQINPEHFTLLLEPIFSGEADMVLGQPSDTMIDYRINPFRALTGERALLKKDIEPILEDIREIRFGVETFINLYFQSHEKKLKYVLLEGLKHPVKYEKTSYFDATIDFLNEGKEITLTLIKNYNLIAKRIEALTAFESRDAIREKFADMQKEVNQKLQELRKTFKV